MLGSRFETYRKWLCINSIQAGVMTRIPVYLFGAELKLAIVDDPAGF